MLHKKLMINICNKNGNKKADFLSLYKTISRKIKDWYNHRSYSLLGGLNIYFLKNDKKWDLKTIAKNMVQNTTWYLGGTIYKQAIHHTKHIQ